LAASGQNGVKGFDSVLLSPSTGARRISAVGLSGPAANWKLLKSLPGFTLSGLLPFIASLKIMGEGLRMAKPSGSLTLI
jgi:hypothetical protein